METITHTYLPSGFATRPEIHAGADGIGLYLQDGGEPVEGCRVAVRDCWDGTIYAHGKISGIEHHSNGNVTVTVTGPKVATVWEEKRAARRAAMDAQQ